MTELERASFFNFASERVKPLSCRSGSVELASHLRQGYCQCVAALYEVTGKDWGTGDQPGESHDGWLESDPRRGLQH